MANEKISELLVTATEGGSTDFMLISKNLGGGSFESQKITPDSLYYDSGWKEINDYNGSFGLANIGFPLALKPKIRVVGRHVVISGVYRLPLSSTADGLTINNDYNTYPTSYVPWLYRGVDGGFNKLSNTEMVSNSPLIPADLYPEYTAFSSSGIITTRNMNFVSASSLKATLQAYIPKILFTSDGKLYFGTTQSIEQFGSVIAAPQIKGSLRELCTIMDAGDRLRDYTAYGSVFDSTGTTDKRLTPVHASHVSDITIDATDGYQLGGFDVFLNLVFEVNPVKTIEQIKLAFDSI